MQFLLLLTILAGSLITDAAIADAARSLSDGEPAAFLAAFDPSMPGFAQLKARLAGGAYEVAVPEIRFLSETEDRGARTLEMTWQVRIVQNQGPPATTERKQRVKCRVAVRQGALRIVSFEPLDLFAPPDVSGAWDLFPSAAAALDAPALDPHQPLSRLPGFLRRFDSTMPGFEQLRANVGGLLERGDIHSSLDLVRNEGDDQRRTVEVEWTLEVVDSNTGIALFERTSSIVSQVERRRREWRIVSFDPPAFFAPPPAAAK
jgi:hypothetical protein